MTTASDYAPGALVPHPVWCRHVPESGGLQWQPDGTVLTAPAPTEADHEGHTLQLECGDTFAYTLQVTPVQHWIADEHGDNYHAEEPQVILRVRCNEVFGDAAAYLSLGDVDALIKLLAHARDTAER